MYGLAMTKKLETELLSRFSSVRKLVPTEFSNLSLLSAEKFYFLQSITDRPKKYKLRMFLKCQHKNCDNSKKSHFLGLT